jgi:hypothetical protein
MRRPIVAACEAVQTCQYLALIWDKNKVKKPESWLDYWQPRACTAGPSRPIWSATGRRTLTCWFMRSSWAHAAGAVPYMENEQVWLLLFWNGRALLYARRGLLFGVTIPKEGAIALVNRSAVPIGAANKKLTYAFINFCLEPDTQRAFCVAYRVSPERPDITGWPHGFADAQITTEATMAYM